MSDSAVEQVKMVRQKTADGRAAYVMLDRAAELEKTGDPEDVFLAEEMREERRPSRLKKDVAPRGG